MKKLFLTLLTVATMFACAPVESSFSVSATYLYTLRAEFTPTGLEIGVPDHADAKQKVDSIFLDYILKEKLGGLRRFAAAGTTPGEMQNMLYGLIKKTFDSLAPQVALVDIDQLIEPCQAYCGGVARLVYEVTLLDSKVSVMRDTIVEAQRINFVPRNMSFWEISSSVENEKYTEYVFDENNVVVLGHSGGDEPTTYTMDSETGVLTVAAVAGVPEHTLTFKNVGGRPCLLSSANDELYFLLFD